MALLLPNDEVSRNQLRGYRIFIWSHDHPHPPHVHIRKGKLFSTWDIRTLACIDPGEFSSSDIRVQAKLIKEFRAEVLRSWNAHWQA